MSTFNIQIVADPGSATTNIGRVTSSLAQAEVATDKVNAGMKRVGSEGSSSLDKARASASSLSSEIQNLIVATGAYIGISHLSDIVDSYTEISNRLRAVASDQANLNGLTEATFEIAQHTRTEWDAQASTFQRLTNAMRSLGSSQKDVLVVQETLTEGLKIGGASAQEAQMAMMELSHSFSVGTLQGREFRVMMKDATPLMAELQKVSGQTTAAFAEMGKRGQITAQMLRDWLLKAAPDIADKFEQTMPTITDSLTLVHNAAEKFFGEAGTGSGVLGTLAGAIKFVADHFDTLGRIVLGVGEALLGLYALDKVIGLITALGALVFALTAGISLVRQFSDQWDTGMRAMSNGKSVIVTVGDVLHVLWTDLKEVGSAVIDFVETAWKALTGAFSDGLDGSGIDLSLRNVLRVIAAFAGAAKAIFNIFKNDFLEIFGGLAAAVGEMLQGPINKAIDAINKVSDAVAVATHPVAAAKGIVGTMIGIGQAKGGDLAGGLKTAQGAMAGAPSGPHLDHIDLTGASDALLQKLDETQAHMAKDVTDTIASMDKLIDSIMNRAAARAASRTDVGSTVSDARTAAVSPGLTKEQEEALKKLEHELLAVSSASNPMIEAQNKLAKAVTVTDQAMKAHLITQSQADKLVSDTAAKTADARAPYEAWVRTMEQETAALGLSSNARELANKVREVEHDLREKGLQITPQVIAGITEIEQKQLGAAAAAKSNAEQQAQLQALLTSIRGPTDEYNRGLSNTAELLHDHAISGAEAQQQIDKLTLSYLANSEAGKTMTGGLERGLLTIKQQVLDVGATVSTALVDAFGKLNDTLTTFITTGAADWGALATQIENDLVKLSLQGLEQSLVNSVSSTASSTTSGVATGAAIGGSMTAAGAAAAATMCVVRPS